MTGDFTVLKSEGWGLNYNGIFFQKEKHVGSADGHHHPAIRIGFDTNIQYSYHSNERESRPKTKFFSLLIYAGYPIV